MDYSCWYNRQSDAERAAAALNAIPGITARVVVHPSSYYNVERDRFEKCTYWGVEADFVPLS